MKASQLSETQAAERQLFLRKLLLVGVRNSSLGSKLRCLTPAVLGGLEADPDSQGSSWWHCRWLWAVAEKLRVDGLYSVREGRLGYGTSADALTALPQCSRLYSGPAAGMYWCASPSGRPRGIQPVHPRSTPETRTTPRVRFHGKLRVPKFTCSACASSSSSCLQGKSGVRNHPREGKCCGGECRCRRHGEGGPEFPTLPSSCH